jgi:hypothetical protein
MASRRSERGDRQIMTWQHKEVVILQKNVRDLQESLTTAHKRIAELADIVTNKNVSLKAIGGIVEEELEYKKPMYDQVPLKDIREIVSKEIVSL